MTKAAVLFRCDASAAIGAGHVARCVALAEALAAFGHRIVFAVREPTRDIAKSLTQDAYEFVDLTGEPETEIEQIARLLPAPAVMVLDHYGRDTAYETRCRALAKTLLVFDDNATRKHDCDLVLDSAASQPRAYKDLMPQNARLLAGPAFAPLRSQFAAARASALVRRDGRPVRSILVSMGATDPGNVTANVLDVLAASDDIDLVTVVLSSRAPHLEEVRSRSHSRLRLVTESNDMPGLMSKADLAIGAGGSTSFERACLGLPALMVLVADNQRDVIRLMAQHDAAIDCGGVDGEFGARLRQALDELKSNPARRVAMSKAGSKLVDGRGALRVLAALAGEVRVRDGAPISLRLAEPDDEAWLLELQRQPSTRRFARQPEAPSAAQHAAWFKRVLDDPKRLLLIVERHGSPAGMMRLDRLAEGFEVSIAISEREQGRGIGFAALTLARRIAATDLLATVLPGNSASQALFAAAGYLPDGENRYRSRAA